MWGVGFKMATITSPAAKTRNVGEIGFRSFHPISPFVFARPFLPGRLIFA